ncbi:MAG: TonB-dependent receptor [Bacteroidales bacterium]|nr:TonB-dependent receptor [Bacteroidales bacterium]
MFKLVKRVLTVLAAVFVGISAYAQVTTSSMSGRISDDQGPLMGVAVVAVHQPTGTQFYAVTDAKGYYYLSNITAGGPYTVEISCLGYATQTYTDISVALSDNYNLSATLKEETLSLAAATVSVEGRNSNMNSDRAGSITSLGAREISKVPTINRSLNDVLKQTPQAYVSGTKAYIGGGSYRDSYVTVDGAAMNNAFGIGSNLPAGGSPISLDALEQMAISITPYDVRQSGFTGGGISATTKSGTNEVKVTAYSSYQNQNMQRSYASNGDPYDRVPNRYLMYGASVGAPIIKDKLFIFLSVEKDSSIEQGPTRKLSQRTVDASGKLVDSGTVFTNGNDGYAYPSAVVLDAVSKYLNDKYGYDPGPYTNYNYETPSIKFLGRIDWNINRSHKLNVRYNMVNSKYGSAPSTSTTGFGNSGFSSTNNGAMYALYYKNARYYQEQNFSSVAAELTSRFLDGRLGNSLRATYSHQYEPRSVDGGYFPFVDLVVNDVNGDGKNHIYTTFGTEAFSYGNLRDVSTVVVTDELTYNAGMHNILAGLQYEYDQTKNGFQRMGAGAYVFEYANEQALYDAAVNGSLLNMNNASQFAITHGNNATFAQEYPRFNFDQFALYLQDQIAMSDNFKLTAGIRFEVPVYPSLDFNRNERVEQATFAPTPSNPAGKYNTTNTPAARLSFSPRIGFNWDVLGDRRLVVRGGTGIFVGRIPFVWIVGQSGDAGVLQTTVTRQVANGQALPTIGNDRMAILNQIYPNGFSAVAAGQNLTSITLMDPNLKNPASWKSSLAFDFQLPGGFLASIEGIYKKDLSVTTLTNIGLKSPTSLLEVPDVAARPYYANGYYDSQITDAYLINSVDDLSKTGYYYSVTAKLEKSFWKGFAGSFAYTYSDARVINDGVGDQPGSAWKGLITQRGTNNIELGAPSYVLPHRIVANASYSVDYGKFFGTTIALAYYGGTAVRTNLDYVNNIFGDGAYQYSLIDVPTKEQLANWTFANNGDYTADQQKADFEQYIQSNKYLSSHRGDILMRNALTSGWRHSIDLKVNQNFYFFTGADHHRHTLQLGVDINDIHTLLNPAWGRGWTVNTNDGYGNGKPLNLTNPAAVYTTGAKPVFQFQKNGTERLTSVYTRSGSSWQMIFSVRYIF